MKRLLSHLFLLSTIWVLGNHGAFSATFPSSAADHQLVIRFVDANGALVRKASTTLPEVIRLKETGAEETVTVVATGLTEDISLQVGPGFEVTPTMIKAGTESTQVTVRYVSTLRHTEGKLILRSGDIRTYVNIVAEGTPLPVKDISTAGHVFDGSAVESQMFNAESLSDAGYTIEIKARTDDASKSVLPYAVTSSGLGFKSYVRSTSMGLLNRNAHPGHTLRYRRFSLLGEL